MATPDELEKTMTLRAAVSRYDELRARDAFAEGDADVTALTQAEALELLALGEVIARKARYGRQLAVRSARRAGASWSQIGAAVGTSKQTAWETHNRWIDEQARTDLGDGHMGMGETEVAEERSLAGSPDDA
ncbi:hypothetical protein [Actinomadura rudentiformis]|uniref:Uncharacterized protein n=1 Tax=Actinomadura rudentiformis TaxID=359158 RepID=A0A6H9YS22_9ACTN|nr:hypothetical protein [Actinomadura rudentiformis]KAB2346798.1 hypothetical protein F8566_21455 [Actinomadura rudentiformis]